MAHICFITGLYSRYDPLIFHRQGKGLMALGYQVSIVVCDSMPDEVVNGINIYSTHFVPKTRLERFRKTKKAVLGIADQIDADIYQLQDPEHISLVSHFLKKKKKTIFNMREYYPDAILRKSYIPLFLREKTSSLYKVLMRKYFPKYGAIFAVTPELVSLLEKDFGFSNIYLLANFPIPNPIFQLTEQEYMERKDVIIYEGTIYASSRQNVFMDALLRVSNVEYLLVGKLDGNDSIKQHPYWNKVEFIDGFSMEELKGYFGRSTISNTLRDFGGRDGSYGVLKIFESMEAALPVILTDVPLYREMVEEYHCGICANPNNVESVTRAIQYLVDHKKEAYIMGQNGRKAVLEKFNWWKQMEIYDSTIKNILINNNRAL